MSIPIHHLLFTLVCLESACETRVGHSQKPPS